LRLGQPGGGDYVVVMMVDIGALAAFLGLPLG
jgi:hypothetical protein